MNASNEAAGASSSEGAMEMSLEVILIPVSDVDRSKRFYTGLGWRLDADVSAADLRLVQLTPPGSGCSIQFGSKLTDAAPGSSESVYLVVSDVAATRQALKDRGVSVSDVFHEMTLGGRFNESERVAGPAEERGSYGSFVTFRDPDGNGWLLQEITTRLPGRVDPVSTSYASTNDLAAALRRAAAAHGEHEKRVGEADPNWPDWYAEYMTSERAGEELPT